MSRNRVVLIVSVLLSIPLLVVAGGVLGYCVMAVSYTPEPSASVPTLTATELASEWKRNPAAASAKYDREQVRVTGYLRKVSSNIHRQTYIEIDDGNPDLSVTAYVLSSHASEGLRNCRVGQRVTVTTSSSTGVIDIPRLIADDVSEQR